MKIIKNMFWREGLNYNITTRYNNKKIKKEISQIYIITDIYEKTYFINKKR